VSVNLRRDTAGSLRVKAMATAATEVGEMRTREELKKGIAELYDESSGIWEDIWGDHMHHGFYDPSQEASLSHHKAAQIRLIEEALRFAGVSGSSFSSKYGDELCQ